ncbi:hypothetical protein L596_020509 [Steinernema carpocapsae]|uniref:Uncharacterized protein n=1 Tax=Steinernema carpocapsae TaxID=34508 RepID=A0A4U5MTY9_STECR|nr:hypothetical protein L596_020509 [Steinernema carpocapsae]
MRPQNLGDRCRNGAILISKSLSLLSRKRLIGSPELENLWTTMNKHEQTSAELNWPFEEFAECRKQLGIVFFILVWVHDENI